MKKDLIEALADPKAKVLVHGNVRCDVNGNSRAKQAVYTKSGICLYSDKRVGSYWYDSENERREFEKRGGIVIGFTSWKH